MRLLTIIKVMERIFISMISLFLKNNWEAIAIAVIIGALIFSFSHIKDQRDTAIKDLNDLKATYNAQVIENNNKLNDATVHQKETEAEAHKQIEDLGIDKGTLIATIKGYYNENTHAKPTVVHDTGKLLPPTTSGSATEVASGTEGLTESERECRSTINGLQTKIEVLENGLAEETIEFNRARNRVDQDCTQIGCGD
jgi:hypothetical protein